MADESVEVFPPCEFVLEEMTARKWNSIDLARKMKWDRGKTLDFLNNQIRIDLPISETLARVFGNSPGFWRKLQRSSDAGDKG